MEILSYDSERVEIAVNPVGDAMLVLTDSDFPGWRAAVDAVDTPIYAANGLYRAVPVTADSRRVVFSYLPASFRWGASVSILALTLTLGAPLAMRWRSARTDHLP